MGEKLNPSPISSPQAGPFAETAVQVRKAVAEGKMTAEQGLKLTEAAYHDAMINQTLGLPVDTESIELTSNWPVQNK